LFLGIGITRCGKFQFQHGSIKSAAVASLSYNLHYFNSNMVRLKAVSKTANKVSFKALYRV